MTEVVVGREVVVDHTVFIPVQPPLMKNRGRLLNALITCIFLGLSCLLRISWNFSSKTPNSLSTAAQQERILQTCAALKVPAGPPADFYSRNVSGRFQLGTKPTLIRNATIWTGEGNGMVVVLGDILLDGGIIKAVGHVSSEMLPETRIIEVYDAKGAWITPGLGGWLRPLFHNLI